MHSAELNQSYFFFTNEFTVSRHTNFFFADFPACHAGQFRCQNALCIPATFHCGKFNSIFLFDSVLTRIEVNHKKNSFIHNVLILFFSFSLKKMAITIVKMNQTKQIVQQLHAPIISSCARKVARTVHQNASLKYNFVMVSDLRLIHLYKTRNCMGWLIKLKNVLPKK